MAHAEYRFHLFRHLAGSPRWPAGARNDAQVLAFLDDAWFHYITDIGNAGPDKGMGGKFLLLPPDYKGDVPEGYFVARSRTYGVWYAGRGFKVNGDPKPGVESLKKTLRIYPLGKAKETPPNQFLNVSGIPHNTIHANNYEFYNELNEVVQAEADRVAGPGDTGPVCLHWHREGQALRTG